VPLLDLDGSTIGLVNAANVDAGPVTNYTYDPSGNPTASGTANDWPFQYQGMEKEFTDPAPYYYNGNGQFYSPQMVRSLSEAGQTSAGGTGGGPAGNAVARPAGSQPSFNTKNVEVGASIGAVLGLISIGEYGPIGIIPGAILGAEIGSWISFFEDIFGGSSNPPPPRQLLHGRHPLYPNILGVQDGLIPDEKSAGPEQTCGDLQICNTRPLRKPTPAPPSACSQYDAECSATPADSYACAAGDCCRDFGNNATADCIRGCLLNFEAAIQASGSGVNVSRLQAHEICYATCGAPPNLLNTLTGDACRKLEAVMF
jgi:hypothetical protein